MMSWLWLIPVIAIGIDFLLILCNERRRELGKRKNQELIERITRISDRMDRLLGNPALSREQRTRIREWKANVAKATDEPEKADP